VVLGIANIVDVDLIKDVVPEAVEVRAARRNLDRDPAPL